MIVLKITNASEIVASKLGQFLEGFTPQGIDESTVEDQVINKMIENLSIEGVKGELTAVSGIDLDDESLIVNEGLKIRKHKKF